MEWEAGSPRKASAPLLDMHTTNVPKLSKRDLRPFSKVTGCLDEQYCLSIYSLAGPRHGEDFVTSCCSHLQKAWQTPMADRTFPGD